MLNLSYVLTNGALMEFFRSILVLIRGSKENLLNSFFKTTWIHGYNQQQNPLILVFKEYGMKAQYSA